MPNDLVLDKEDDENYVMFSKLLAEAVAEGRIDGKYRCPTCGMRYKNSTESTDCCTPTTMGPREPRKRGRPTEKLPEFQPMR